ncbi:CBS domain-containing protein [Actinomycetospora rhizophila]|uniref:CBS domain-containing protein n=1 Tax=Actinomycetospora rhizophila TaxID=1416876 RepID=A0ABV9ZFW6_9PSEU
MTTRASAGTTAPRIDPSRPVRVVGEHVTVAEALRVMRVAGVRHLPVIADGLCVGLLLDRDLVAAAVDGVTGPVGHLARRPVPTVEVDATTPRTARAVLAGGLDAALVTDGGVVVGIVTATDALAALAAADGPGDGGRPTEEESS